MDEARKEALRNAGIDTDDALERFMGNAGLYQRFALGFIDDKNYEKLLKAMEEGDVDTAFAAAHTMKGVCGNLSFGRLYRAAGDIVEPLRAGELEGAKARLPELKAQYEQTLAALKEWKG